MKANDPFRKNVRFGIGVFFTVLEGLLSACVYMAIYLLLNMLLNNTVTIEHLNNLTFLIIGFFTVRLITYGFGYTQGQIGGGAVSRQIRLYLGDKFKRIPLSRFHQGQIGQYVNTMTSDVSNYEQILTHRTGNLVKNISLSVMLILFVCVLYLPAGLILIAISLLFIPNMWLSFRIVKKYGNARNSVCAEAVSSIVEYVNGIQTLRAYGMSGTRNKTTTDILREYSRVSYKYEATGIPVSFFFNMLTWLSLPAVMLVTSKPWMSGIVSGVDYLMVAMMPMMLAKLYMTISVDLFGYKNMMISKRKIQAVVNEPEEAGSMEPLQTATHEINFDNVDFSYVPGEPVLKHATFTVPDQKLTAIVGDSGSGKSTILNLIAKYYEADGGTISIGGKPINHVAAERVLEQISMVDQDVFLFDDTIRDNIRHARPNATDEEIEAACREAKPCKLCLIDDLTISLQPKHCLFVLHGPCPFWEGFQSWLGYIFIHLPAKIFITVDQEGNLSHIRRDFFIFISEIHAKTRTTAVRTAVATVESVFLIPHFARIDVTPAKKAEPAAYRSHILHSFFPKCILLLLIIPQIPPVFHLQYLLMTIPGHQSHFVSIFFPNVAF